MKNIKKISFFVFIFCLALFLVPLFDAKFEKNNKVYANTDFAELEQNWLNNIAYKLGTSINSISVINFVFSDQPITEENELYENIGFEFDNKENILNIFSSCTIVSPEEMENFIPENYIKLKELNLQNFQLNEYTKKLSHFIGKSSSSQLTQVKLKVIFGEYFDTSNVEDMSSMFDYALRLKEVHFGTKFYTHNVKDMSKMFYQCQNLTSVNVSQFDTQNVENMSNMFCGCKELTTLDVSNFDTSNVTNMALMFNGCEKITELHVENFDTSNVVDTCSMFNYCKVLTSLDVSGFDTSNVENMNGMFCCMFELQQLDVSGFDTSNVTDMSWMFADLYMIEELDVSGFDTSNVEDMSGMFECCYLLESIDLSSFDTANVVAMESMFSGMSGMTYLDVRNLDFSSCVYMCDMFSGCENLEIINLQGIDTSCVENFSYMFCGDYKLKNIIGIEDLDLSSAMYLDGMFSDAYSIESLDLSKWDVREVLNISYMFDMSYITEVEEYETTSLKYLDLSGWQLNNIDLYEWSCYDVFAGCDSLETIILPYYKSQKNIELPNEFYIVDFQDLSNQNNTTNILIDYTPTTKVIQKVGTEYKIEMPDPRINSAEYIHKNTIYIVIEVSVLIVIVGIVIVIQRIRKHEK